MGRREIDITLNRDRDYPRFSTKYLRRRWSWRTMLSLAGEPAPFGIFEGDAAFGTPALIAAHFPGRFVKFLEDPNDVTAKSS